MSDAIQNNDPASIDLNASATGIEPAANVSSTASSDFDVDGAIAAVKGEAAAGGNDSDSMDIWNMALEEQNAATPIPAPEQPTAPAPSAPPAPKADHIFRPLSANSDNKNALDIGLIGDMPVLLTVELGRTQVPIRDLLGFGQGAVIELDNQAGSPMDIYVNGLLIAQGEVVVVGDNKYGMRLTDIVKPSERLAKLSRR